MTGFDQLVGGFAVALSWKGLLYCFIGCLWGTIVGVLPGLGPLAGMTLLLPLTFGLEPTDRHHHADRHLLRRHVRRLDHLDPGAHSWRSGLRGHLHRRLRDGAPGPRRPGADDRRGRQLHRRHRLDPRSHVHRSAARQGDDRNRPLGRGGADPARAQRHHRWCRRARASRPRCMVVLGPAAFGSIGLDKLTGVARFTFGNADLAGGLSFTALAIGLFGLSEILINLEKTEAIKAIAAQAQGSGAALEGPARIGAGDRSRLRHRVHLRHHSRSEPRGLDIRVLRDREAVLEAPGGVRQGRDRRRCRTGDRQQRGDRHRHDPAACARHPLDPGDCDPDLGADHSRRAARTAAFNRASRGVLGPRRQHVYRQRHPAHPQPAAGRDLREPAAHSLRLAGAHHPDRLDHRRVQREFLDRSTSGS